MTDQTIPEAGTLWRDRRPSNGPVDLRDWRRVIEVTAAEAHGFVEGQSFWQHEVGHHGWTEATNRRKTRIRMHYFQQRFERVDAEEQP